MCPESAVESYSEHKIQEQQYVGYPQNQKVGGKFRLSACWNFSYVWKLVCAVCDHS